MVEMTIKIAEHTEGVALMASLCGLAETYPMVLVILVVDAIVVSEIIP